MDIPRPLQKALKYAARKCGYNIAPRNFEWGNPVNEDFPHDFTQDEIEIIGKVKPYTMTSPARVQALIRAVKYVINNDIPGDIVECGVWKGGSMMAAALTLSQMQASGRSLYLYDTFEGMVEPDERDVDLRGGRAPARFEQSRNGANSSSWCCSGLDSVKLALHSAGYDPNRIFLIQGKVEDTLPRQVPERIALLRLDTDWYESTKCELIHLYPRLSRGGVLILDDYGHWMGARKAADEYIAENNLCIFLNRIDYSGRLGIKLD